MGVMNFIKLTKMTIGETEQEIIYCRQIERAMS